MEMADGQEHEVWYCFVRNAFGGTQYGPHQPEDPPCECNTPRFNPAKVVIHDDAAGTNPSACFDDDAAATATRDGPDDDDDSMSSCD